MPASLSDDRPVRWGVLGAGGIAATVCDDIVRTDGNVVTVVGARDLSRAETFAERYSGARGVGSYADVLAAEEVDAVYVATTHPGHRSQALDAIAAGKAVLIEKPVCLTSKHAHEVFDAARKADVFAMEAMWMRTNPLIRKAEQLVADGAIGELRAVRSEFGLGLPFDAAHRLYDLDNGGGSLLDIGIYPVTLAFLFLGMPDRTTVTGTRSPTGSDDTVAMLWQYENGLTAQLWCSTSVAAPNRAALLGTHGWIATEGEAHRPSALVVNSHGTQYRIDDPNFDAGNGYTFEIAEVARCLRAGLAESPLIPHADTVAILSILDDARAAVGVRYPGE